MKVPKSLKILSAKINSMTYIVLMITRRCFTDLQCDGYSFAIWLKISQSALDGSGHKAIFSSGALGSKQVTFEGVTLVIVNRNFRLNFKRKEDGGNKWKATSVGTVEGDKWM